ncbi:MAG TPA: rhomboid family intramembrane serine protease, partial [Thermoanaerobaculia bacterium]
MNVFALTSDAAWWEVWRLWTAHLVHYSAAHLALNAIAALPPALLLWRGGRPGRFTEIVRALFLAAPAISIAILLIAHPYEYRGASALVVMLWVYAGFRSPVFL